MPDKPTTSDLNAALLRVSDPLKPKKKRRTTKPKGTGELVQKKRSSASHNRTRRVKEATNLAHITKAIVREGGTVPDVGMILGCQAMEGGEEWLAELKAKNLSITEFLEAAKNRVDIELIRVAVKAATGYGYEEESQEFTPVYINEEGAPDAQASPTGEYLPGKKNIKKRYQPENTKLLWDLLRSRLPDYFNDTKHIKIDKRVVEIKADAKAEIRSFTAGLAKSIGCKVIEAEFVEKEVER